MFSIARVTNSLIANNGTGVLHTGGNGTLLTGGGNSMVGNTNGGNVLRLLRETVGDYAGALPPPAARAATSILPSASATTSPCWLRQTPANVTTPPP